MLGIVGLTGFERSITIATINLDEVIDIIKNFVFWRCILRLFFKFYCMTLLHRNSRIVRDINISIQLARSKFVLIASKHSLSSLRLGSHYNNYWLYHEMFASYTDTDQQSIQQVAPIAVTKMINPKKYLRWECTENSISGKDLIVFLKANNFRPLHLRT